MTRFKPNGKRRTKYIPAVMDDRKMVDALREVLGKGPLYELEEKGHRAYQTRLDNEAKRTA